MSVKVIGVKPMEKEDGSVFYMLELQGSPEPVLSHQTGRYYLTMRTTAIPTTFDARACEQLVGTELRGSIIKVEAEPYEYKVPETGEVITLRHTWRYDPFDLLQKETEKQESHMRMA